MKDEIRKLGIEVTSDQKSITIGTYQCSRRDGNTGRPAANTPDSISIETYDDHRIAMCFGVLNSFIGGLKILNPECVNKTYPKFWEDLEEMTI